MLHLESSTITQHETAEMLSPVDFLERGKHVWDSLQVFFTPTALCADRVEYSSGVPVVGFQTKPTNMGLGLLSVLCAEKLRFISPNESEFLLLSMLKSIGSLEREKGFFFDWYDALTAQRLITWPESGAVLPSFISSVDNAWLAASLQVVSQAKPELSPLAESILTSMDFAFFFDEQAQELWGGYDPVGSSHTPWHYSRGYFSESRIVHYVAAAAADSPTKKHEILGRLLDKNGEVPASTYGGSLFEQLASTVLVEEPDFLTAHKREIDRHIRQSHPEGWWGLSACDDPNTGKYTEIGVGGSYPTLPVVSPYSLYLALMFEEEAVGRSLARLEHTFEINLPTGYLDSVDIQTGRVAQSRLFLDQALILISITDHLVFGYFQQLMSKKLSQ